LDRERPSTRDHRPFHSSQGETGGRSGFRPGIDSPLFTGLTIPSNLFTILN